MNVVFTALRIVGRLTRLPMDKGFIPIGVSQYILDGTWEHSLYWQLSFHRGGITQPLDDKLPGLKMPEHVSNLDL